MQFVGENAVTSLLGLTNGRFLHFGVAIHRKTSYVLCRTDISWGKHFAHYVLMENNPSASAGEIVVSSYPCPIRASIKTLPCLELATSATSLLLLWHLLAADAVPHCPL